MPFGLVQKTKAQREREAAVRLGLGWVIGVGWERGPLLLVSAADARRATAVRDEVRRVERMTGKQGASAVVMACYRDGAALRVRVALASVLASDRILSDLFGVDSGRFAVALGEAASAVRAREIDEAARAAAIEREMMEVR
jgi:hypothetical protein